MKNCILLLAITMLALSGCSTVDVIPNYAYKEYNANQHLSATVGSRMMGWFFGTKYFITNPMRPTDSSYYSGYYRELIYGGIDHNVIQLTYREYHEDAVEKIIRDAFSQSLKYDLTLADTITFQDIRIKILTANQASIEYIIYREPAEVLSATNGGVPSNDRNAHYGGISYRSDCGFSCDQTRAVKHIERGMPAYESGMWIEDTVTAVDGQPLSDPASLTSMTNGIHDHDIIVTIKRAEVEQQLTIWCAHRFNDLPSLSQTRMGAPDRSLSLPPRPSRYESTHLPRDYSRIRPSDEPRNWYSISSE